MGGSFTVPQYDRTSVVLELPFRTVDAWNKYSSQLSCYRHAAFELERQKDLPEETDYTEYIADLASKLRVCRFFFKHEPGYDPKQHLELREKMEERESARRWGLVMTLLGATIALLAVVIEKLL